MNVVVAIGIISCLLFTGFLVYCFYDDRDEAGAVIYIALLPFPLLGILAMVSYVL